jgi:hypothetical protein
VLHESEHSVDAGMAHGVLALVVGSGDDDGKHDEGSPWLVGGWLLGLQSQGWLQRLHSVSDAARYRVNGVLFVIRKIRGFWYLLAVGVNIYTVFIPYAGIVYTRDYSPAFAAGNLDQSGCGHLEAPIVDSENSITVFSTYPVSALVSFTLDYKDC